MNVLLIYPKYPDTYWSFKHVLKFVGKKAGLPPLGLLTIASMMPKEWKKKLVDINVAELTNEQIKWADMVFISAMLVQKKSAQEVIIRCKRIGKTVVVGGPAFTTQHEQFVGVDHYVLNEGEITFPLFLEDFKTGKAKRIYTSTERPDILKTPIPMWSLINFKDYFTMTVQFSRGCPFNCEFCDIIVMNGRVPRTKSKTQFISEIQALYDAGWRGSVFIVDDNFIGNKQKVKEVLLELISWQKAHKYPFNFITEASVNLADDKELMDIMSAANFSKVFLGIETPNLGSLKECGKMQNASRNLVDSIKIIHRHGMQVMGGFIVGFDSDAENIFESQINFIQKTGVVTAMVGILTAMPQTRLWHRLKSENRLTAESTGENTDGTLNFIPKMGSEKLINGYKKVLSTIYDSKHYYKRVWTFIKGYKVKVKPNAKTEHFHAFFRSVLRIGIFSRDWHRYWTLLGKTLFVNYKAIPLSVESAIYGLHFQKVTKRVLAV